MFAPSGTVTKGHDCAQAANVTRDFDHLLQIESKLAQHHAEFHARSWKARQ